MKKITLLLTAAVAAASFSLRSQSFHAVTNTTVALQPVTLTPAQVDALIPVLQGAGLTSDIPITSSNLVNLTVQRVRVLTPVVSNGHTNTVPQSAFQVRLQTR